MVQHAPAVDEGLVSVNPGRVTLEGNLLIPHGATGVVLFAHGSGSSRFSSRNRHVASVLRNHRLGTLLIDLLTPQEERIDDITAELRFDIGMLADRLAGTVGWLREQPQTRALKIGLFGASTGGGAALVAAAKRPQDIHAVVSRGGRPDLAGSALPHVQAPTLLIVGGYDTPVIEMNREAYDQMTCERRLEIVPRASHLFEEPGALEKVAELASAWFERYLAAARAIPRDAWASELRAFSGQHHGWLVTIECDGNELARLQPLDSVDVEPNGTVTIRTGHGDVAHRTENTTAIRIAEESPGAVKLLTIESSAERVTLRFRSAIAPELVDGVVGE